MRRAPLLLTCLLVVTACAGDESRTADAIADCVVAYDDARLPEDATVALDAVALPTKQALRMVPSGRGDRPLWSKYGLIVASGTGFELRVADEWRGRLAFEWGRPATAPVESIRVPACASRTASPWLAFSGGYYSTEFGCMAVVVLSGGDERRVDIGIGAPCAGQAPPPTAPGS
jgi:hypothetical protein